RQKPDPQPENENELNDEQVIDLTQIVEGGDDNDVIDLTDILEEPDQALGAVVEPEEAVIPLVDAIPTEPSVQVTDETDDEIIDLTEVTSAPQTIAVEPIAESAPALREDDVDEETAGTMEQGEPTVDVLDAEEPLTAQAETIVAADDEFANLESRAEAILTDAADADTFLAPEEAAETAGPDSDFMAFEEDEAIRVENEAPAMIENEPEASPAIPESLAAPLHVPASPSEPVPLTEAQVEAALERTILKIYGEKIEQLMIRTIEKTVTREIARIKNALLDDEDDDRVG
ncbi:MAG: hypothetical protein KFF68_12170, partial [Desulfosarcina sp.]|nr:hypothetical protein [Desulfosarcina sp.]